MKTRENIFLSFAIGMIVFSSLTLQAYASIETTQFDLHVTSEYFHEPNINKYHLVMKPGESQQVTIQITNNDSESHTINLQMSTDDSLHKDRIFSFEPEQITINPDETKTSILTVTAISEASTGTTIWHTLIAKSTTFGAKAIGFYVGIHENPTVPQPDMVRRGSPGGMFSSANFDISEDDAIKKIPYEGISTPSITNEYSFYGMHGLESPEQLIYSKQPVLPDTRELEFWDNDGLLISFRDNKHFTYDQRLGFLGSNEQQVRINGENGTASGSLLISTSNDQKIYSNSRVTVFLDDVQLRIESQIPLEEILKIAESMAPQNKALCKSPGMVLVGGVCQKITDSEYILALNAYEKLNDRTRTDSGFEQLFQTEVVGFGVDEPNKGIFIVVEPKFATKENLEKYENIFRETIGDDIPVRFEINERGSFPEGKDPDYVLLVLVPVLVLIGAIFYFWRKRR